MLLNEITAPRASHQPYLKRNPSLVGREATPPPRSTLASFKYRNRSEGKNASEQGTHCKSRRFFEIEEVGKFEVQKETMFESVIQKIS